jgi:hypothetical protein
LVVTLGACGSCASLGTETTGGVTVVTPDPAVQDVVGNGADGQVTRNAFIYF